MGIFIYIIIIYLVFTSIKSSNQKKKDAERSKRDWEIIQKRKEFIENRIKEEQFTSTNQTQPQSQNSWEDYAAKDPSLPKDVKLPPHLRNSQRLNPQVSRSTHQYQSQNTAQRQQRPVQPLRTRNRVDESQTLQTPVLNTPVLNDYTPQMYKSTPIETQPMNVETFSEDINPSSIEITSTERPTLSSFEIQPIEITSLEFSTKLEPMSSLSNSDKPKTTDSDNTDSRTSAFLKEYGIEELKIEI